MPADPASAVSANHAIVQLDGVPPVGCPCGQARRGFTTVEGAPCSVHIVEISRDSRVHYHKRLTETYTVLEGEGQIELDGETVPLRPMTSVMIRPGCRHRATPAPGSTLKILNVVVPPFDPADEWEDG